jgi:hypothetical protein
MWNVYDTEWRTVVIKATRENALSLARMKWPNCVVDEKGKIFSYTGVRLGTMLGYSTEENN